MISNIKKIFLPLLPFFFLLITSACIYFYVDTDTLLEIIGTKNSYLMMFVIAFLGGLTTFNFIPYYSVIFLLVNAGLNPFLVGASSALGVMCGDTFSYFMGYSGGKAIPENYKYLLEKMATFAQKYPNLFIAVSFIYGSISPLSNDFITIPAGIVKIPYIKVMIPLALGNLVFNISLSYLILYAFDYVKFIFN